MRRIEDGDGARHKSQDAGPNRRESSDEFAERRLTAQNFGKGSRGMQENAISGVKNRLLQHLARSGPGATSFRVWCHRRRGVTIGRDVWIGYDSLIETGFPSMVTIGDRVVIGVRATI